MKAFKKMTQQTPDILLKIVATKREELAAAQKKVTLETLKTQCRDLSPTRNFFAAMTKTPNGLANIIAEVKKASPSVGVMKGDFDPVAIAQSYARAGADAISVLTDEQYFKGHLDYLRQVRAAVDLPLLRKDFTIDAYQIWEARAAGADAVLLIAEILEDAQLIDYQILAAELGLTALVEVHDMENLLRVRSLIGLPMRSYSLLGINNRDLRTFQIDVGHAVQLAELVEDKNILIAESGIRDRMDIQRLNAAGIQSFLIGETLMRTGDVAGMMANLKGIMRQG